MMGSIDSMKILAIDPGSRIAGFACLEADLKDGVVPLPQNFKVLDVGLIKMDLSKHHSYRIGQLHIAVFEMIKDLRPDVFVLEKAFYGVNVNTALKLGETRGALISAARRHGLEVREITPASVKKVITGKGQAPKEDVAQSLQRLLGFDIGSMKHDASDAVALALSFGLMWDGGGGDDADKN